MRTALLAARLPMPGPAFGAYPERPAADRPSHGPLAVAAQAFGARLGDARRRPGRQRFVARVHGCRATQAAFGSTRFDEQLQRLRADLGRDGCTEPLLAAAFAMVGCATEAVSGIAFFDSQLAAARILLDGRLAEMATGEGKTHAAMLAAATAALAGVPVHVVTANAYLAARDADRLAPVYRALGLAVAAIRPGDEDEARRAAYACDIVYCTASDLIFDYLRDGSAAADAQPLLRGLCMALIDEADSVLIDEARTPFILAEQRLDPAAERRQRSALALARALREGEHFRRDAAGARRAVLLPAGRQRCADIAASQPGADPLWSNPRFRDELVELALAALHLYRRDVDYLLRAVEAPAAGNARRRPVFEVAIVDATTGRIAVGRRWSNGLHQLIELKEGCPPSPSQSTRAQLTYQRFFPRYWRLAGTSGTLREARRELQRVYGLAVETVPLRRPSRRRREPLRVYGDSASRWQAALAEVERMRAAGRPVLVGTDSVADAQHLADLLHQRGIAHQRLDAHQDSHEAACIERAGAAGCVTVATNMAGRGTDILLAPGVAERGGLHVVCCQQNASARIDRQLQGRAGRAGEPGSVATLLALDGGLLAQHLPRGCAAALRRLAPAGRPLPAWLAAPLLGGLQRIEEARACRARTQLQQSDDRLLRGLGFGGQVE